MLNLRYIFVLFLINLCGGIVGFDAYGSDICWDFLILALDTFWDFFLKFQCSPNLFLLYLKFRPSFTTMERFFWWGKVFVGGLNCGLPHFMQRDSWIFRLANWWITAAHCSFYVHVFPAPTHAFFCACFPRFPFFFSFARFFTSKYFKNVRPFSFLFHWFFLMVILHQ